MVRKALPFGALVLVTACSDPGFQGVPGVREITQAEAGACSYIADIRARPGVYGPLAQQGLEYTRNQILADARDLGGNAVVFEPVSPGTQVYEIRATAYRC